MSWIFTQHPAIEKPFACYVQVWGAATGLLPIGEGTSPSVVGIVLQSHRRHRPIYEHTVRDISVVLVITSPGLQNHKLIEKAVRLCGLYLGSLRRKLNAA